MAEKPTGKSSGGISSPSTGKTLAGEKKPVAPSVTTDPTPGAILPEGAVEAAAAETPIGVTLPGDHYETGPYGTLHTTVRTEVGSAFASTAAAFEAPDRQEAVLALAPLYRDLSDAVLHTIVEGVEPAGPYLNNPDFPEEMLRALGKFEQDERKAFRERQETQRTRKRSFIDKVVLLVIGGVVTLALKALFFPS